MNAWNDEMTVPRKTVRVADLSDALLDFWTARANGTAECDLEIQMGQRGGQDICVLKNISGTTSMRRYAPSTDWHQGGPLIERYQLDVSHLISTGEWSARRHNRAAMYAELPLQAICRAIVVYAFGQKIEVPA